MLSVQSSVFYRPKEKKELADQARKNFARPHGDHIMLLAIWNGVLKFYISGLKATNLFNGVLRILSRIDQ